MKVRTAFDLINTELFQAISDMGYKTPSPIQERAIPAILEGKDIMGCAQTGTGKTAAFALPILHQLAERHATVRSQRPLALILAPTRELAAQIEDNLIAYTKYQKTPTAVVFGGVGIGPQQSALRRGVAILVATPGRLLDLCKQRQCFLDAIETVVLDEADRMLDMGFLPDIRRILDLLPRKRQSLFFSATLSADITALARSFLTTEPVTIRVDPGKPAVERIRQRVCFVDKETKYNLLKWFLDKPQSFRVIVFPRMKHGADRLCKQLTRDGYKAAAIHGDKSQNARMRALDGFKDGKIHVLVATDIAARGIDIDDVTHVINYDLPDEAETYVHRIGRTARAGAEGEAISLVSAHDRNALRNIEKFIRREIPQDLDQPFHSEAARTAMGAAASRPPRGQGGARPAPRRAPRAPRAAADRAPQAPAKPFYAKHTGPHSAASGNRRPAGGNRDVSHRH